MFDYAIVQDMSSTLAWWSFKAYVIFSILGLVFRMTKTRSFGSAEILTSIAMIAIGNWTPHFKDAVPWEDWLRYVFSYRLFDISPSWGSFLLLLVVTDYLMYWEHVYAHKWRFFWALHSVHHSSYEFNLGTTALRNPPFMRWIGIVPMGVVLCLAGWGLKEILLCRVIVYTYSVWVHADVKMGFGPLGKLFVSPDFHRLHHARNPGFLECNYGYVFSLWDWLHGTARVHKGEVLEYGLVGYDMTLNPFVLFFREWWKLLVDCFSSVRSKKTV